MTPTSWLSVTHLLHQTQHTGIILTSYEAIAALKTQEETKPSLECSFVTV